MFPPLPGAYAWLLHLLSPHKSNLIYFLLFQAIDCGPPKIKPDIEVKGGNITNTSMNARVSIGCKQYGFTFSPLQNFSNVDLQCGNDSKWKSSNGIKADEYNCVRMGEFLFILIECDVNTYSYIIHRC